MGMFQVLVDFFTVDKDAVPQRLTQRQRYVEEYLSQSTDRIDLERRERELERKGYYW